MGKLRDNTLFAAVTCLTALGFMQIGFDNGLMGGLVNAPAFQKTFDSPGPTMLGLIVSILEIGAFAGSLASAFFGERLGRRKSVAIGVLIMSIGSLLQATAYSRAHMIVARIVAGVGLGITNSTVPVLQAEYSPKASRGLYVCMQLSVLNFGIFLVYWIDYAFATHTASYAWRVPTILQQFLLGPMFVLVWLIDETPRWLVAHDRREEALDVLRRLRGHQVDDVAIQATLGDIVRIVEVERAVHRNTSWSSVFKNDDIQSLRRLAIACGIQAMQQLGGISLVDTHIPGTPVPFDGGTYVTVGGCIHFHCIPASHSIDDFPFQTPTNLRPLKDAIIYYSSTLFTSSIGFSQHMSALMSGFLQTWFFLASFIPWLLIDRIGRRPLLLSMISVMAAVMATQAALIYQVENKTNVAHSAGIAAAAMLFVYQGAFTIGFQATVWVYPSEILPLRLRQVGSSISTSANWIMNYMIVQITPPAISNIGWRTYIIFAVLNALWVPIIYLFFPETKCLELEDVDRLFAKQGSAFAASLERSVSKETGAVTVEKVSERELV